MLQPFERLLPMYVDKLEKLGKKYFVTQYYARGINHFAEVEQIPLIVSVYDDLGLAKTHLNALKADKYGAIIDMTNPEHKTKLWDMVKGHTKFVMYWAVVKDAKVLENKITLKYKEHMRRYISTQTNWRIAEKATLNASVQLIFGELYINLKHGSQHLRIKFEEIEKVVVVQQPDETEQESKRKDQAWDDYVQSVVQKAKNNELTPDNLLDGAPPFD